MTPLDSTGRASNSEMGRLQCLRVQPRSTLFRYTYEPDWINKGLAEEGLRALLDHPLRAFRGITRFQWGFQDLRESRGVSLAWQNLTL